MILKEGGNIFKDENGNPYTQRIARDDVDPTLDWLEKITGIKHKDMKLGSTGIRSTSGDLDVAINAAEVDKKELEARLVDWVKKNHPDDNLRSWVAKSGISVHFKTPILGNPDNGFVQTDLMFGDPSFMKFALKGTGDDTPYKGMHRMIMISSIAKAQGMKFSSGAGLANRETGELISKDPDEIAKKLLGPAANRHTMDSVETINTFIKTRPDYQELIADAKDNFEAQGLPMPESKGIFVGIQLAERERTDELIGKAVRGLAKVAGKGYMAARDTVRSAKAGYAAGRAAFSPGGSLGDMGGAYAQAGGPKTTIGQVSDKLGKAKDKLKAYAGVKDDPITGKSGATPLDDSEDVIISAKSRNGKIITKEIKWKDFPKFQAKGWQLGKISESIKLSEGARIEHLEDLVFRSGVLPSQGASRALQSIIDLEKGGHENVTVKWDGSPALIFGRDENGEFIFTDKSGFVKKGGVARSKSAEELKSELLGRSGGKLKDDPKRIAFADKMAATFDLYKKAVPDDYRGFFKGDLLYYSTPKIEDGYYVFQPQLVKYQVKADSDLGKKIANSTSGIVIHREVDADGQEGPLQNRDVLKGNSVLVFPSVTVEQPPKINNDGVRKLATLIKSRGADMDKLLDPATLEQNQMKALPDLLYAYINSKVDTGLANLGKDFIKWLDTAKVSMKMKQKVTDHIKKNITGFSSLWTIVSELQNVKDDIIRQLDSADSTVKATTGGKPGGEGYVIAHPDGDIKLVNRSEFTAANRAVER